MMLFKLWIIVVKDNDIFVSVKHFIPIPSRDVWIFDMVFLLGFDELCNGISVVTDSKVIIEE